MLYREFVAQEFKKRPTSIPAKEYMKKVAMKWKKMKTKKGGALQQMEVETTPVSTNPPIPPTKVEYIPDDKWFPSEPKGVWFYWHPEDLSPIDEHGGGNLVKKMKKAFNKVGEELKKSTRLIKPLKRAMNDYPIRSIRPDEPVAPYLTLGTEKRKDGDYQVATVSTYFADNPAMALGWQVRPKDKKLGYHLHDIEFVSIYYLDNKPVKVFFSQHSVGGGEGVWKNYQDCQLKDGYLVVYAGRNSHANFPTAGTHVRVFGVANDITSADGPNKAYTFQEMNASYDWDSNTGIKLYKGLRPAPPDYQMSQRKRILRV